MIDCGEHIEEMIRLFKVDRIPLVPEDIAINVLDTLHAQGAGTEEELDQAFPQIVAQVEYMLTPAELAAAKRQSK